MTEVSRETPPAPLEARGVFAAALPLAEQFVHLLATEATVRGLIGPREVPRLWERHLLNCGVVTELIAADASVCDVGSGAGLPGIALAIRRPDLKVTLLEPLLRRTTFLHLAVAELGLDNVTVLRGRAEETKDQQFDVVTSRAVAPMDRLARWSLPLTRVGGLFLAMKGSSATVEVDQHLDLIHRLGGREISVESVGEPWLRDAVTVVRTVKGS